MKIGEIDLTDASWTSIDVGMIICEDLSHDIWTIPNDTTVDIPATTEWIGRAQTVLLYMLSMGLSLKEGMCHWRGVYVAVVAVATTIATHHHLLHCYSLLWGLKSLVESMKFVSWVKGKKIGKNGPRHLSWRVFITYFMMGTSPPSHFPSPITLLSENDPLTSLWKGVWLASVLCLWGVGVWAHIPQGRGGAPGWVDVCGQKGVEVVKVHGGGGGRIRTNQHLLVMQLMLIKTPLTPSKIVFDTHTK